jgi:predicted small metal-binding protein
MAHREYKQLSCTDTGVGCDFLVGSEKEDEVVSLVTDHACRVHNACEIPLS